MSFGSRLKEARKEKGLSLEALSARAQVTKVSIIRYEKHGFMPFLSVAVRLAAALGASLDWLAGEEVAEAQISIDDVLPMEAQICETECETPNCVSRETNGRA